MEKLNIAELLKDCPSGMELDCTICDNVYFDEVTPDTIRCYYKNDVYNTIHFHHDGTYLTAQNAKCVIFPKGKTTWEGFVPPYKYEDGDILYAKDEGNEYILILKEIDEEGRVYCYLNLKGDDLRIQEVWLTDYNSTHRLATEEEKERLFKTLKDNGYRWNDEIKTLDPEFKDGDILVGKGNQPFIYEKRNNRNGCYSYCGIDYGGRFRLASNDWTFATSLRFATKEEKQKLFDAIKENGYKWNPEAKTLDKLEKDKFDITTLKPFNEVLVRQNNHGKWGIDFFGFYSEGFYHTTGSAMYVQCVPYKDNEHLCGTTNDCDDYYKTWE